MEEQLLRSCFDYRFSLQSSPLNLDQLYTRYVGSLLDYMEEYNSYSIDCFIIIFTSLPKTNSIRNVNSIAFNSKISNVKSIRKAFTSSLLPFTLDESKKLYYSTFPRTYIDYENKVKRVVTDLTPTKTQKDVYSQDINKHLETFIDEKLDDTTFTRHNPNSMTSITIRTNSFIKLPLIKKYL